MKPTHMQPIAPGSASLSRQEPCSWQWLVVTTKTHTKHTFARPLQPPGKSCVAIIHATKWQWSHCKKKAAEPLIPGLVFVKHGIEQGALLYQSPFEQGVLKEFGQPALASANKVAVTHGQFKGMRGTLTELKGQHRFVVSLEALQCAVTLDISKSQVKQLNKSAA